MSNPRLLPPDRATVWVRALALGFAALAAIVASVLVADAAMQDGLQFWDLVRTGLILVTTGWLAWGAVLALAGLWPRRELTPTPLVGQPRVVVLVPICNEDPVATFARIAAMDMSIRDADLTLDIAVLSDTRAETAQATEQAAFRMLISETGGVGRIFYRNRTDNRGRKAGNVEDFLRRSGGSYDFALVLDADSLMEGTAIREMVARMQADPLLGLLQTLPRIVGAQSHFGRAMQFASAFHGPVFTRGLERMQGSTGPYWGHNAIIRVAAFAESCALPELRGRAPFGGHILSHDYVEAALLARGGWRVQVDGRIEGSYEEGPDNLLAYAKRDRRWCQGNLQHIRLLLTPGLSGWSRYVFVQGIFAYVVSVLWAAFLITTVAGTAFAPEPDYFPEPYQLFPVFPSDRTREITALFLGIVGLLIMPKMAILAKSIGSGRVRGFGSGLQASGSVLTEVLLTSLLAPIMLMFQSRAVIQVITGHDGGWPSHARGEGELSFGEAFRASAWIALTGALALIVTSWLSPALMPWLLPVTLPMLAAPLIIAWSSHRSSRWLFAVPEESAAPRVVQQYHAIHDRWVAAIAPAAHRPTAKETAHVAA